VDEATLRDLVSRAGRAIGGRRRLLAASFLAVAVAAGLQAVRPDAVPTVTVWAAAHDLNGGRPLSAADVRTVALPVAAVPAGALRAGSRVVGRLLAAPMRRGEPLTDVRLLEPALLSTLSDHNLVAVPIRIADGSAAALVRPGDVVDVLAVTDPTAGGAAGAATATALASGLRVLAVPARDRSSGDDAGLVVVASTRAQATALAQASSTTRLSLAIEHP
jgi:pilus assembly protein CpaB